MDLPLFGQQFIRLLAGICHCRGLVHALWLPAVRLAHSELDQRALWLPAVRPDRLDSTKVDYTILYLLGPGAAARALPSLQHCHPAAAGLHHEGWGG